MFMLYDCIHLLLLLDILDNRLTLVCNIYLFHDQEKHPSALSSFEGMMRGAKCKRIVVFLDYDGTLSPIVNDPDKAFMSDLVRKSLMHTYCTIVIQFFHRSKPLCIYSYVLFLLNTQMRSTVREVATRFPTAIISGRSREKVKLRILQSISVIYHHRYLEKKKKVRCSLMLCLLCLYVGVCSGVSFCKVR